MILAIRRSDCGIGKDREHSWNHATVNRDRVKSHDKKEGDETMNPNTLHSIFLLALITNGCATAETRIRAVHDSWPKTTFKFDGIKTGTTPDGWSFRETGHPTATAIWRVIADATAPSKSNVLALTKTENIGSTFNLAVADNTSFKDLDLSVKVKAITGDEDQGGGPIWRCKDEDNYYISRFNPLEGNYRVYKVVNGRRKQLKTVKVETEAGRWYAVRVTMVGDRITCYLDGKKLMETTDDTFKEIGMIGLWTKADAVTSFDNLSVRGIELTGNEAPLLWEAVYATVNPSIDGVTDDVWSNAKPLTVVVREALGGTGPRQVILRALYTDDSLFVLATWPDATRSDMRDPYVWDAMKKEYQRPIKPDDQFALEFPIEGDFQVNMLTTDSAFVTDVWHWKAGRGNPTGWVDDKRHIIGQSPSSGGREYSLGGRGTIYIARPTDDGKPPYATKPKPKKYIANSVDSYQPNEPTGSRADVRGKGVHNGSGWTLEMARKLNTGHADDAVVYRNTDNPCAIAVLSDELYWDHSVSQLLLLRLVPH